MPLNIKSHIGDNFRIPVTGEIFRTCPESPWGPTSLLYSRYWVTFPGVKRPGSAVNRPPPSSGEVKEILELYLYPSLSLHVLFQGKLYLYHLLAIIYSVVLPNHYYVPFHADYFPVCSRKLYSQKPGQWCYHEELMVISKHSGMEIIVGTK
jgi:hypothetical protein